MTLSFVTIDTWTLIFTWINLAILIFIMKKLLFKPITGIIEKRGQEIQQMYNDASADKQESEKLRAEYEQKLAEAKTEATKLVTDAQRTASLRSEQILHDAQEKASGIMQKADEEIKREKKAAAEEIKTDISAMAVDIAQKVIERDLSGTDHSALISECIDKIGESL